MAVPTISLVTPSKGSTLGADLIEIFGTNFQLPTIPTTIPAPVQPPTVEVLFDGVPAQRVDVVTDGRLIVSTPPAAETVSSGDVAAITVTVRNIDTDGILIPGEEATLPQGFTFKLPELHKNTRLQWFVDNLITILKQRVHPEVMLNNPHTDWDNNPLDGLSITAFAKFPAIVLNGPELVENRFYSRNRFTETALEPSTVEEFIVRRESRTVDVGFEVLLLSDSIQELLNLINVFTSFMHRTKTFSVPVDITDPTGESRDVELDFQAGGDFSWSTEENDSNVRQARGAIIFRGFDIADGPFTGKGVALGDKNGCEDPVLESPAQLEDTVVNITGPLRSPP